MQEVRLRELVGPPQNIVQANEHVRSLRQQFDVAALRSLIAVDRSGPIGIITRQTFQSLDRDQFDTPVRKHVTAVPTLRDSMTIDEARAQIGNTDFGAERLPVVNDQGRLVGAVSRHQLREHATSLVTGEAIHTLTGSDGRRVTIRTGMDVRSVDGKKVGCVTDLLVERDRVRALNVRYGFLGRHYKPIPSDVVNEVTDDSIWLAVGEIEFKFLSNAETLSAGD